MPDRMRRLQILFFIIALLVLMTCETAHPGKNECREIASGYDCSWLNLAGVPEAVPNATHVLDFSFNHLPQLYRETLARLTELLYLDLTRCSIDLLYEGAFSSQNKLRTLILTGNTLKFMSYEAFSGLDSLADLVMPQTSVADLEDLPISELQLRALDVSDGSLHDLEGLTALQLHRMERLNLARNHIAGLRRTDLKAFNGSSSGGGGGGVMMEVNFGCNDIISVEDGAFAGLRFRSLNFRGCFARAEAGVLLRGLEGVTTETLDMGTFNDAAHRSITTQSVRSLCKMTVTHLRLTRQRWAADLSSATFECLAGLRSLDMTEMHLHKLPDHITNMGNLTHLTLDRNEFENICDVKAHNFPSLTWLSLRGPFSNKELIFQNDCLQGLPHLQYLDLSHISLEVKGQCCEGQLRGLGQLRTLNLTAHNRAMSWGAMPFSATPQLQQLDCTGLGITLNGSAPFQNLAQLKALNLSSTSIDITQPRFLEGLKSLVYLNLRGNPVPEGHVLDPEMFKHVPKLQNLTLAECKLTVIGGNLFRALTKLTFADLSANHLTKLSTSAFYSLTNIHLYYAHNGIQMVDVRSVEGLGPSSSIDLSFNPLACNCSNIQFIDWVKANVDKLEHDDETLCNGTQQHISEVTLHCSSTGGIIAFGVTVLFVVAVVAGVFVLRKWKKYDRYAQL